MKTWIGTSPFTYPKIKDTTVEEMSLPCYATPKIDGELNFLFYDTNFGDWVTVNKYGRYRAYYPVTFSAKDLDKKYIYVGELYAGWNLYDFLKVKDNPTKLKMAIFDVVNPSVRKTYYAKMGEIPLQEDRREVLSKVPVTFIDSRNKLASYFNVQVFLKKEEGIVCRTMNDDIFKIKPKRTIEVVILGIPTDQKSLEKNEINTVLVGLYNPYKKEYVPCGKVGIGFSSKIRRALFETLLKDKNITSRDDKNIYVKPKVVIEIECTDFIPTKEYPTVRTFRSPRFKRFRFDKKPEECTIVNQCPELLYHERKTNY